MRDWRRQLAFFFRHYIGVLFFYVVLSVVAIGLLSVVESYERVPPKDIEARHAILHTLYTRTPRDEWPKVTQRLRTILGDRFELISQDEFDRYVAGSPVDSADLERLVIRRGHTSFSRIDPETVIKLDLPRKPLLSRWLRTSDENEAALYIAIALLAFALPVYQLTWRVTRDIRILGGAAQKISAGDLDVRTPAIRTAMLAPLGAALDHMAQQTLRLIQGQKVLSQAVAHEMRTPLARMHFALAMLEEQGPRAERERWLSELNADVHHLESLAEASVSYARLGTSRAGVHGEVLEMATLLTQWRKDWPSRDGIDLRVDAPETLRLYAHRESISLALANLVSNAVRYASARVAVSVTSRHGFVTVTVDDDGSGIPAAMLDLVFEPFRRLDRSQRGFGLGLALVRTIAERHGGVCTAEASPLGGARLRFSLPAYGDRRRS